MIPVKVDVKLLNNVYKSRFINFKTQLALDNYVKYQFKVGVKVIGIHPMTLAIDFWSWKTFFRIDPEYITDETWANAIKMCKIDFPKDLFFGQLIKDKNFKESYNHYKSNLL